MKKKKLLQLADELEEDLSLDEFNFGIYYVKNEYKPRGSVGFNCGTSGCAIGHLAAKGQDGWGIRNGKIVYMGECFTLCHSEMSAASKYFDIPRLLSKLIFMSNTHYGDRVYEDLDIRKTYATSPPEDVAHNIRRVVELKENNQIEELLEILNEVTGL